MSEEKVFKDFEVAMGISGISPILYRINDLSEDAVCIIRQNNSYMVINFERSKYRVQSFQNQHQALIEVIHRIAFNKESEEKAIQNFCSLV